MVFKIILVKAGGQEMEQFEAINFSSSQLEPTKHKTKDWLESDFHLD